MRTTSSQPIASPTGTSTPSSGRAKRARSFLRSLRSSSRAADCAVAGSMPASMRTTVIKRLGKASRGSVRRYCDVLIVDEIIQRLLHVDIGRNDAGLLQCDASGENGLALRRPHFVVRELGALLELLVDHVSRQLGDGNEISLELIVVRQRIFAR